MIVLFFLNDDFQDLIGAKNEKENLKSKKLRHSIVFFRIMIIQSINLKFIYLLSRLFSVDIERSFQSDSASSSARTRTHKLSWSRAGTDRISEAKSAKVLGPRLKSVTSSISQRGLKSQKQTEYKNLNFYPQSHVRV
jgi:hypothetical protein